MAELFNLEAILGITFNDVTLLQQALVHSSYINENPDFAPGSNERLEFLGDAVLGFVVAEKLYKDFPELAEGEMTKLRSALVRRDTLSEIAQSIKLGEYLYLGKGEEASGGRLKPVNLAGAFEAVIAAIFLDQGLGKVSSLILRLIAGELDKITGQLPTVDYKSYLQEIIQSRQQLTPVYRLIEASGPDHNKKFTVEVLAGDVVLGTGSGRSKKLAEVAAARSALDCLEK